MFGLLLATALAAPEVHQLHQLGLVGFPLGVQYIYEPELRFPLGHSDHWLVRDSAVALVGHADLTPAFFRGGAMLHVEPVAMWDFTLRAYGTAYFGLFSAVIPTDDPDFDGTRAERRALIDAGARSAGTALRLDARTRFKVKLGPLVSVLELEARQQYTRTPAGPVPLHWDPTEMLVVPGWDGLTVSATNLTFIEIIPQTSATSRKLWVGPTTIWQAAPQTGDRTLRIGPLALWRPSDAPTAPTLLAGALFWTEASFQPTGLPWLVGAAQWRL